MQLQKNWASLEYNRSNTPPTNSEDVQGTSESYCEIIQNQETTNCSDEADPCEIIKEGFPKRCCRPRTKKTTNSSTERDLHGIIAEERYAKKRCSQRIKEIFESETNQPPPDNLRYPINEYISTNEFAHDNVILELSISEFTMEYIREFGLVRPLLFKEPPEKLGMRMPNPHEFSVLDVQELVGGEKQIHVFDVHTQKGKNMRMKEFVNYYKQNPAKRKKILNSISLEFSDTKLADKIIWLIEPTENNLKLYEKWMLAGNDDTRFLGKLTKCTRVHLRQGDTLIVPSGWIHSVYTPVDSLVFVGNFLHSYSIPMQIRISHLEDRIQPEKIYRFPHFKQIFWAFIAQIVHKATHRIYQKKLPEEAHNSEGYRFSAPKNDQTAKNFVKIDDQWTRASLDGSTESGFSDSENDIENDFQSENNDAVSCQLNSDGHEICYDDLLGNAIDGSFTFNPIQTIYDNEDSAQFTATKNYDINFLRSLPPLVTNGLFPLLRYAEQLLTLKYPEVIEGITRPHHLVKEFRALLDKIHELGLHSDQ
ncbi:hypothetical protein niasHT_006666 [Heterodera trifolii]|uniref:JmjC domain-containing protein n=1 Tax=Heterodera trifolii TaxID=157864 RepID=A0ABD2M9U5_9BILA